jgi:long-chain-fatty-acid--[acyl-carrier-protein] ligase
MVFRALRWLAWLAARALLLTRYRVRVAGLDEARRRPGPYLILPNHPAFLDPPLLISELWPAFRFRPMLLETNFQNPALAPLVPLLDAIKVPDVVNASAEARQRAEAAVAEAIVALRKGESVALWPSGRIMRDGVERVGGNRAVADILAAVPDVTVVLVRTRGMWGSMYSFAQTAKRPDLIGTLLRGLLLLLANLVAFAPKRHVTMVLEAFTRAERPEPARESVNPWLEGWYNADTGGEAETPTYVPYHFLFGRREFEFPPPPRAPEIDPEKVKPETKQAVAEILSERLRRPLAAEEDRPDAALMDLGLDSLDAMEVTLEVEQRFGFRGEVMPTTVGQLWALAEGMVESGPPKPPPAGWFAPPTVTTVVEVIGDTVPEAILNRVVWSPRDVAAADDLAGVLTYERLLTGAVALASRFRPIPEANVGLLMPASVAGSVALLGLHLAGKLPVILNWTTGPGNMGHAVRLTGVKRVVTSRRFIDRTHLEVPGAEFLYLEDVRATVGRFEIFRRFLTVRLAPGWLARRALARLHPDPDRPAVVLFTSGSEKAPKAVPLTHRNVIEDMRAAAPLLKIDRTATVLSFLPFFHSFGHTVTGLFPLFGGVKVVYHPDPTDAAGLVRKVLTYKPTALAATPTFLGYMLDRAKPGDLDSLTLIVVGAEKCPEAIFKRAAELAPNAVVLEGYGVTECSPVVSVNPVDAPKPGTIGKPVIGVELAVLDAETGERLPPGRMGMLHVAGPTVFPGYLGHDGPQPFKEFEGKRWYVTGDLAEIDADGYLVFHGRLKRFLKAAGEMISLPALEEPFARLYPPTEDGPRVAVEGVETPDGKRRIVLFTTEDLPLKEANAVLHREGHRGIMRLDEVRRVDKIPVLGTGKTDYKVLRGMIEQGAGSGGRIPA